MANMYFLLKISKSIFYAFPYVNDKRVQAIFHLRPMRLKTYQLHDHVVRHHPRLLDGGKVQCTALSTTKKWHLAAGLLLQDVWQTKNIIVYSSAWQKRNASDMNKKMIVNEQHEGGMKSMQHEGAKKSM